MQNGSVQVKNLSTHDQAEVRIDDLVGYLDGEIEKEQEE